jgi:hypothetical protein
MTVVSMQYLAYCHQLEGLAVAYSRRQWASSIAYWLFAAAVMGGIAAWEAVRVAEARATVASGWGAGLAAGAGGGLALVALLAVTTLVVRQRPWTSGGPQGILIFTILLLLVVAAVASTPPRHGPDLAPYVITSGIEVAETAYISTFMALLAVLLAVRIVVARVREHRPPD